MQAARRRAPRSAAPRFPAAARASSAPEPTLELRTGRTRRGAGPQNARDPARVQIAGTHLLDAARGAGTPTRCSPRAALRNSAHSPAWPAALASTVPGPPASLHLSPHPPSTLPAAPPPPIHCIRFPFPAWSSPPKLLRPDPATLLGFSVHSWKFRAWTVAPSSI